MFSFLVLQEAKKVQFERIKGGKRLRDIRFEISIFFDLWQQSERRR